jgi:predicted dehydrogenase
MTEKIKWGIIGCGDVTEVKSGPAFNKVKDSVLHAVMRRDKEKAKDYAIRHQVPVYYCDAMDLINEAAVNAIYIATPPDTHEAYTVAAIMAGKPVYVEKPMTLNSPSAVRMMKLAFEKNVKLVVAHYRNAQPMFIKIKEIMDAGAIGQVMYARLDYRQRPPTVSEMAVPKTPWRLNPAQSGGGLFHDLAPHALGLMHYFFGGVQSSAGISCNRSSLYGADDMVSGNIFFLNGVHFSGSWCFNSAPEQETDYCEIFGTLGSIGFSVFNNRQIILSTGNGKKIIPFDVLPHVQQPMIEKVVQYFLGKQSNPCPPEEGVAVMKIMDSFTSGGKAINE